ncbi:MAG: toxin-antitoxin system YwqK family antitoxin [Pirellulales bacterium]
MLRFCAHWTIGAAACLLWCGQAWADGAEETPASTNEEPPAILSHVADSYDTPETSSWDETDPDEPQAELIRERYPNSRVKIERQVTQDSQDNFINHGKWKMWDLAGKVIAEGQFIEGQRDGTWVRWVRGNESKLFAMRPFTQFRGPFLSQASFRNGSLDGTWSIYDSKKRRICQWEYTDGIRDGKWMWWYANGRKMREVEYRDGDIDGTYQEWNPEGKLVISDRYQEGRKLARKVIHYAGSLKQSEGMYLHAKLVVRGDDDWWNCSLAVFATQGSDEKHGTWTSWYKNGQVKLEGKYDHDMQVDTFTWWHPNGQKAAEGGYRDGKQVDKWTWWHKNGLKAIQGDFNLGTPASRWTWWQEDGKVAQKADFSHSVGQVVDMPVPDTIPTLGHERTAQESGRLEQR